MSIESTIERWKGYAAESRAMAEEAKPYGRSVSSQNHIAVCLARATIWELAIDELSAERDTADRVAWLEKRLMQSIEEGGRFANAFGRVECALGLCGNNTLDETVQAVEDLVRDARELARVAKMRGDSRRRDEEVR